MKKVITHSSNPVKTIAVFVVGMVVATLGWYYADRLNVAYGQSAEINIIGAGRGDTSAVPTECKPGDKRRIIRKLDGCSLVTQTISCVPVQKYINSVKTRTGSDSYVSAVPKRFSKPITVHETISRERRSAVATESTEVTRQVEEYRRGKSASALTQDENYKELVASQEEVRELQKKAGPLCPPVLKTTTGPATR
jgi:hypothetical protein